MSEPKTVSRRFGEIVPGVFHWSIHDERIDFRSEAYLLDDGSRRVAIDPLPLSESALVRLGPVDLIVLTGAFHQRAAWRLRRAVGAPVWAPVGAVALDERPDRRFADGDEPVAGLTARLLVGPNSPHAVLRTTVGERRVLWCGDLVMRGADGPFGLVPTEHRGDPAGLLESVRELAGEGCDVLCPAHGAPLTASGTTGLTQAIEAEAVG